MFSNRSRCPNCSAFICVQPAINKINDVVFCRCCGLTININDISSALVAGTRRAETVLPAQSVGYQNGSPVSSESNAHYSNFQPNGKIKKFSPPKNINPSPQMDLFGGAQCK